MLAEATMVQVTRSWLLPVLHKVQTPNPLATAVPSVWVRMQVAQSPTLLRHVGIAASQGTPYTTAYTALAASCGRELNAMSCGNPHIPQQG